MIKLGYVLIIFLIILQPFQICAQGDWFQIGLDIDGEAAQDRSASSVDLSADGNFVVIGAELNDGGAFAPSPAGTYTYTVTGTDANGCENTESVDVNVYSIPTVTATAVPDEICLGNEVTLTGFGADIYSWDGGVTDGVAFTPIAPVTFEYVVTGTDLTTGCENTDTIEIIVNDNPIVDATATPDEVCLGESIAFAGTGADVYVWDGGVTDGVAFTPTDTGSFTYRFIGTDLTTNCSSADGVIITVYPIPEIEAFVTDSMICLGESVTFSATGGVSYEWDPEIDEPYVPSDIGLQVYTVTGYSEDGCSNTASVFPNPSTYVPIQISPSGSSCKANV
ncbi:MAG: hypothetical protein ACPG21_11240 [Crocinitomicaceae bacterium]